MIKLVKSKIIYGFPVLRHRNFRYFWYGQCLNSIIYWVQTTALQWLVYSLTSSPFLLGLLGGVQFAPYLVLSLHAGVFVDRFAKKRILITTQIIMMLQPFILAILIWTNHIQYWHILALVALKGCADTLDLPTRQSFFIELVGKDDILGATALNSAVSNIARIIGPAISGIIMAFSRTFFCFLLSGMLSIPILFLLFAIKTESKHIRNITNNVVSEILDGIKYIAENKVLSGAILSMLAVGTFALNISVLIPVFAKDVLGKEAGGFSSLLSAMGIGAVIAAVYLSIKAKNKPNKKGLYGSAVLLSTFLIVLGFVHHYYLAMIALVCFGFCNSFFLVVVNSIIQLTSSDQYRGRTMSIYILAFYGTGLAGNLFAGFLIEKYGANIGFFVFGTATVICIGMILLYLRDKADTGYKESIKG
ncbi:MAG: hypothetical protein APF77_18540 [Clostridia bacterium BRH_c25]|nr:MAG: hypothetical protein APF77_18540 [Clostridia bacterium BRH_c25]